MGPEKCMSNFVRKPEGKNHLQDLGVYGRILLGWILGNKGGKLWTKFISLRRGTTSRFF